MESTAPTVTPARRRTIRSIGESKNRKSASQEEDALIFFSSLETQSILEYMTTFSKVGNPRRYHLNNTFSFLEGFSIPGCAFPLLPNYRPQFKQSQMQSHTQKNHQLQRNKLQRVGLFFLFLVIFRCQIHGSFNCLLLSSFSFMFIYIMKNPKGNN